HDPTYRAGCVSVRHQADGRVPHAGSPAAIPLSSGLSGSNTERGGRWRAFQSVRFAGGPPGYEARNILAIAAQGASSSATNARPCGRASSRTASRSIVLSDKDSRGATNGPGSVASAGFGGTGNLASTALATASSHFFFSALAFWTRVSCSR